MAERRSAEEIAREIVDAARYAPVTEGTRISASFEGLHDRIAKAIREARAEAFEEAARAICDACKWPELDAGTVNGHRMHYGSCGGDGQRCKHPVAKCEANELRAMVAKARGE